MPPKTDLLTIIPKPKIETPKWVNISFLICVGVWVVLLGCFIFFKTQASSQQDKKASLESQIAGLNTKENQDLEKKAGVLAKKIKNFSLVFKEHKNNFRFFDFLRNYCHPNVRFSSLNLTSDTAKVILVGETDSYQSLTQQIMIFKKNPQVKELNVSDISLSKEGKITFQFDFKVDEQLLTPLPR